MDDIVILSGARTAIGTFGGSLAGTSAIDLGALAARAALERAGVEGEAVPRSKARKGRRGPVGRMAGKMRARKAKAAKNSARKQKG